MFRLFVSHLRFLLLLPSAKEDWSRMNHLVCHFCLNQGLSELSFMLSIHMQWVFWKRQTIVIEIEFCCWHGSLCIDLSWMFIVSKDTSKLKKNNSVLPLVSFMFGIFFSLLLFFFFLHLLETARMHYKRIWVPLPDSKGMGKIVELWISAWTLYKLCVKFTHHLLNGSTW